MVEQAEEMHPCQQYCLYGASVGDNEISNRRSSTLDGSCVESRFVEANRFFFTSRVNLYINIMLSLMENLQPCKMS